VRYLIVLYIPWVSALYFSWRRKFVLRRKREREIEGERERERGRGERGRMKVRRKK
jgi:hypothetical protein